MSNAVLAVWNNIDPEVEDEFNDWYWQEHVPERLAVPGFLNARRGLAIEGAPKYCAFYELESLDVLRSAAYLERLARPSARTRAIMPHFRNMNRSACTVSAALGNATDDRMTTLALTPATGRADELRATITHTVLPELLRIPGVSCAQLWEADRALSVLDTEEQSLRPQRDRAADWVVAVDHTTRQPDIGQRLGALIAARGQAKFEPPCNYRLLGRSVRPT